MSGLKFSIVMGIYRRPTQFRNTLMSIRKQSYRPAEIICTDDGVNPDSDETREICKEFGVDYYQRINRPEDKYVNSAIPLNISIKRATGDILIIQCPECRYEEWEGIEKLITPVLENPLVTTTARVQSLNPQGEFDAWILNREHNWRFLNFCQAVRRDVVMRIGGFDEQFKGPGFDDDDFELRLFAQGVTPMYVDTLVSHQYHTYWQRGEADFNLARCMQTRVRVGQGEKPIANEGVDWGNINS